MWLLNPSETKLCQNVRLSPLIKFSVMTNAFSADIFNIQKTCCALNNVGRCLPQHHHALAPATQRIFVLFRKIFQTKKLFWHMMAESLDTSELVPDEDDRKLFVGGLPQVIYYCHATCWSFIINIFFRTLDRKTFRPIFRPLERLTTSTSKPIRPQEDLGKIES